MSGDGAPVGVGGATTAAPSESKSLRNAENLRDAANEIVRTGRVSRRAGWAEYLVMILTDAADCIEALAQQPAPTLPDVDDDDLTVAYMAGRHDGRKEAQQPAAVDGAQGYYLAYFKGRRYDPVLWWGPNNAGYTPDLEQAGVYTKLTPGFHDSEYTVPVPVSFISQLRVRRIIDTGDTLNQMFWSADTLRAALAAQQGGDT